MILAAISTARAFCVGVGTGAAFTFLMFSWMNLVHRRGLQAKENERRFFGGQWGWRA